MRAEGVRPRGDQLCLSGDTREKPLSSTNTSVACSLRHFFYPWPNTMFPVRNRFVITLNCQSLYLLPAPVHPIQQTPHTTQCVTRFEQIPDHTSDAIQCPIILTVTMSVGSSQEFLFQSSNLFSAQAGWLAWRLMFFLLRSLSFLIPAVYTTRCYANSLSNGFNRFALTQQCKCSLKSFLKLLVCAVGSHESYYDSM